jgi:heparin binding hemagglutinin HbhA
MTNPKTTEKVFEQVNYALEQVRTPLLAALGAGNLAGQAVLDAVNKAKARVTEGSETARRNFDDLPGEVDNLRGKLDPAELRKAIEEYTEAALRLYGKLAESGEQTWDKVLAQPQVKKAMDQLEEAVATAQTRAEDVAIEARGRVDGVLGKVSKQTRSTGEKTARRVKDVAGDVAEKVEETGDDVASETRSVSRKAANRTAPKATNTANTASTAKATSSTKARSSGNSSGGTGSTAKKPASGSNSTTRKNTSGGGAAGNGKNGK